MEIDLPNCHKPCKDCPFRKDSMKGWLGAARMKDILNQGSFTCHKTNQALQCAGHMIIRGERNDFVQLATRLRHPLNLSGKELIFETEEELINHHSWTTQTE